ncbi:MAG: hypothetical protein KDC53_22700 [Saprospiraceae bacterium]|nr:hypothetical protein [Saprospiraceae bacterium]
MDQHKSLQTFYLLLLLFFLACKSGDTAQEKKNAAPSGPKLTQLWVSDTTLRTPESVLYDPRRDLIYVSNINLNPWEKDGNGFISRLALDGSIIDLKWVEGLNAPKGMGILDDHLFVADIDEVVEIDIATAKVLNRYLIEGNPTLNDITVGNGIVYISGSDSNKVFALKDGTMETILEGDFGRPNGLFIEPERLLMLTSNSSELKEFDLESKTSNTLVSGLGHGDGIVPAGDGDYLASNWQGEIFYIPSTLEKKQLLDTRKEETNAADIEYVIEKRMLFVPTFFKNSVIAFQFEK